MQLHQSLPLWKEQPLRAGDRTCEDTTTWLDLQAIARLHASSEEATHRIDDVLSTDVGTYWRAAAPGPQLIEMHFDPPRNLARIRLVFVEEERPRTQQFTIDWSSRRGEARGEVVRQQFNFSPFGATREVEDYRVELRDVETLRIRLIPDIGGRPAFATLAHLQVG